MTLILATVLEVHFSPLGHLVTSLVKSPGSSFLQQKYNGTPWPTNTQGRMALNTHSWMESSLAGCLAAPF